MWKVGDEVRLNRGWTRMVVIKVDGNSVPAKYDSEAYAVENRVTDWCFENPDLTTNKYTRAASGFTAWDGAPATKVYYTMKNSQYEVIAGPYRGQSGLHIGETTKGETTKGEFILETPAGQILHTAVPNLKEILPNTFRVRAVGSSYKCSYDVPPGVTIGSGELLLSNSGNMYLVTGTDTGDRNTKGVFKGRRLVTQEL